MSKVLQVHCIPSTNFDLVFFRGHQQFSPFITSLADCCFFFSSAKSAIVRHHVLQELTNNPLCFGDFIRKEFGNQFLKENVSYISGSDLDHMIEDKRVIHHQPFFVWTQIISFLWSFSFCSISNYLAL